MKKNAASSAYNSITWVQFLKTTISLQSIQEKYFNVLLTSIQNIKETRTQALRFNKINLHCFIKHIKWTVFKQQVLGNEDYINYLVPLPYFLQCGQRFYPPCLCIICENINQKANMCYLSRHLENKPSETFRGPQIMFWRPLMEPNEDTDFIINRYIKRKIS